MANIDILIQNGSIVYAPIVEEGIEWETERKGVPGKLTFKIIKDDVLDFEEGNAVLMRVDGENKFYGFVFSKKRDKDGMISVTAYDQLRYLKNKDCYIYPSAMTASMYESITYEAILQRMLERVSDTVDKREGSIIYDALAPAAAELAQMYIELDVILNETFADTASRTYLIKRAAERGISPNKATYTVAKGEFNINVDIEKRFSLGIYNYTVTEKISNGVFKLTCETAGSALVSYLGTLIPIDYIEGLTSAKLTAILIAGEDEESTEDLRERYFDGLSGQAFGGNIADYKSKVNALDNVGGVKVYPTPNNVGGTVKLVIIGSDYKSPTETDTLIEDVQTAVDPVGNSGKGVGIAPIGHVVTVEEVASLSVNITTQLTYESG